MKKKMSTQTAMKCTKCKEVLNNQDNIFGTSCGHLYHFICLRECHGQSTNCLHCDSYKPFIFKMFLEFGEATQPISWEDQTKTIELHSELEKTQIRLVNIEEKHKFSQVMVQKLEGKLKKLDDALKSSSGTVSDLEDRIATLEDLNKFLSAEVEKCNGNNNNFEKLSKSQTNNKMIQHLSKELENEIAQNAQLTKENIKLKAFINITDNENEMNITDHAAADYVVEQTENGEDSKHNNKYTEEKVFDNISNKNDTDAHEISGSNIFQENEEQSLSYKPNPTRDSHTVCIHNFPVKDLVKPVESAIITIAYKMDLSLSVSEIARVITIKKNLNWTSLIVSFHTNETKNKFLKNKNRLKKFPCTRCLYIK